MGDRKKEGSGRSAPIESFFIASRNRPAIVHSPPEVTECLGAGGGVGDGDQGRGAGNPLKKQKIGNEEAPSIMQILNEIKKGLDEGAAERQRMRSMLENIESKVQGVDSTLADLVKEKENDRLEREVMKKEIEGLKNKVLNYEKRLSFLERDERKNNLIVRGLADSEDEDNIIESISTLFREKLGIGARIMKAERLGRLNVGKNRPVKVTFRDTGGKYEALRNRSKLRGTKIFIDEDYPQYISEKRRILTDLAKKIKQERRDIKFFLRGDKLVINNEVYELMEINGEHRLNKIENLNGEGLKPKNLTETAVVEEL